MIISGFPEILESPGRSFICFIINDMFVIQAEPVPPCEPFLLEVSRARAHDRGLVAGGALGRVLEWLEHFAVQLAEQVHDAGLIILKRWASR